MKIIIEEPRNDEEDHIIVKCRYIHPELMRLLNSIKSQSTMLTAYIDNEIHRVDPNTIYYIEAVDNKVFLYSEHKVYESKQKLYELSELLNAWDFFRISKSQVVNLSKITSLLPALSGRLEAVLMNGEKVIISRQYVSDLKKMLNI